MKTVFEEKGCCYPATGDQAANVLGAVKEKFGAVLR